MVIKLLAEHIHAQTGHLNNFKSVVKAPYTTVLELLISSLRLSEIRSLGVLSVVFLSVLKHLRKPSFLYSLILWQPIESMDHPDINWRQQVC